MVGVPTKQRVLHQMPLKREDEIPAGQEDEHRARDAEVVDVLQQGLRGAAPSEVTAKVTMRVANNQNTSQIQHAFVQHSSSINK